MTKTTQEILDRIDDLIADTDRENPDYYLFLSIRAQLIAAQKMAEGCETIIKNDKTQYDYHGKTSLNRNGKKPPPGQRFVEPREVAAEALAAWRGAGGETGTAKF